MKKILMLMSPRQLRKPDESTAFIDVLKSHELDVTVGRYEQLSFFVSNSTRTVWFDGQDIAGFDAVYFRSLTDNRGLAATTAFYLREKGIPFIDQETAASQSFNKLQQMFVLSQNDIHIPTTFLGSQQQLKQLVHDGQLMFPLVVKGKVASRGRSNYLVNDFAELQSAIAGKGEAYFIVQNAIPNNGDYRVLVLGDDTPFAMYRQRQNDASHLNNTSQGAIATTVDPENSELTPVLQDIKKSARIFGRNVAGVDVIFNKLTGEYAILEVNRSPQLTNGAHVDQKVAAFAEYLHSL